ncbi:26345_t:CDS:1, partial [Racocetra persica]
MSLVDTIPSIIVVGVSSISLILQTIHNRKKYVEIPSDEVPDDIITSARFSTVKRDVVKLGITILQAGLFTFLFCWRFNLENNVIYDAINTGILAICW